MTTIGERLQDYGRRIEELETQIQNYQGIIRGHNMLLPSAIKRLQALEKHDKVHKRRIDGLYRGKVMELEATTEALKIDIKNLYQVKEGMI